MDDNYDLPLYSEILPGLWQGGTGTSDTIDFPKRLGLLNEPKEFDSVVTCFSWAAPMNWYVHENRFGFVDGPLDEATFLKIKELAVWLHSEWKSGRKCLSRCAAGWNRSGLVVALVLIREGYTADEAIQLIREKRSPNALSNESFVKRIKNSSSVREVLSNNVDCLKKSRKPHKSA